MELERKDLSSLSTDDPEFEELDREDVVDWLLEREIPLEYCKAFKGLSGCVRGSLARFCRTPGSYCVICAEMFM